MTLHFSILIFPNLESLKFFLIYLYILKWLMSLFICKNRKAMKPKYKSNFQFNNLKVFWKNVLNEWIYIYTE